MTLPAIPDTRDWQGEFDKLTERQIEALGHVAFGGIGAGAPPRTLKALAAKGFIEPVERTARDRFGVMRWTVYTMPIHVHIEFCEWCSKQELPDV